MAAVEDKYEYAGMMTGVWSRQGGEDLGLKVPAKSRLHSGGRSTIPESFGEPKTETSKSSPNADERAEDEADIR